VIAQRHRILRQVLEVRAPAQAASDIQNELGQIQRQDLEAIIDECCSDLSSPDRIHRIDKLEVDLGSVPLQSLETQLPQALKSALRKALQSHIELLDRGAGSSDQHPAAKSQLELVAFFASTGTLPWWADSNRPRHLRDSINFLLEHAPVDLAVLFGELARHPRQLQRILLNCEDATLIALFNILLPLGRGSKLVSRQLQVIVRAGLNQAGPGSTALRIPFWIAVSIAVLGISSAPMDRSTASITPEKLRASSASENSISIIPGFWPRVFTQLARDSPGAYAMMVARVIRGMLTSESTLSDEMAASLLEAVTEVERRHPGNLAREVMMDLARLLRIGDASPDTSEPSCDIAARKQTHAPDNGERVRTRDFVQAIGGTSREEVRKRGNEDRISVIDLAFADADRVYIENSGLVILWLFLERFFGRLQLLKDNDFKDAPARHRAAGLLQYIATEDSSPPEYQMTLNKLMCGIDPDEVLDFGPAVTEAEAEECANLISAVIENALVLRKMSHNGFRGSFLLRKGVVSAGESSWILRVGRETFDVVLDRFPWAFSWVKLPWMEIPLGVEW